MVEFDCAACGRHVAIEQRSRRKYCAECKSLPEVQRNRMVRQRAKEQEKAEAKLAEERRLANPFDPAYMSDHRLGAVIRLFKMTYGTYTSAYRSGMLLQILKAKGFADPEKMLRELEEK